MSGLQTTPPALCPVKLRIPLLLPVDANVNPAVQGQRHARQGAEETVLQGKLGVASEGLSFLASLGPCVAPIVMIGPYRSGKSFTLNQLLEVDCGECSLHF
jgi:hypothetical protein